MEGNHAGVKFLLIINTAKMPRTDHKSNRGSSSGLFDPRFHFPAMMERDDTVCEHQPRLGHERAGAEGQSSNMSVVRIVSRLSLRSYPGLF